jgi:hypothetical protein
MTEVLTSFDHSSEIHRDVVEPNNYAKIIEPYYFIRTKKALAYRLPIIFKEIVEK